MHLSDTFIQSDLQCIQAIHFVSMFIHEGQVLAESENRSWISSGIGSFTDGCIVNFWDVLVSEMKKGKMGMEWFRKKKKRTSGTVLHRQLGTR